MRKNKFIVISIIFTLIILALTGIVEVEKKIISTKEQEDIKVSAQEVKDVLPPVITLKGDKSVTIKEGESYKEQGYSATDDVDGSVVGKVAISKKEVSQTEYKLIYTVSDKAGNVAKAERTIHIEKKEEPVKQEEKTSTTNKNTTSKNQTTSTSSSNKNTSSTSKTTNNNKTTTSSKTTANNGVVYLTFDDGPSTYSTPKILDILKKNNVKATFFLLNYNSSTESLVKREVAEGHSVGIHGYSHSYKKIYQSEEAYMENLNKLQAKIYKSTNVKTTITRFPGGSSNTVSKFNPGIMTRLSKLVVENGYTYYDWNVSSGDAGGAKNSTAVYNNVVKNLSKSGRNIVLMHDFSGNDKTINALDKIIKYCKENGFTFKTITSDTAMMKHKINN